jgi:hypothetical protein
VVRGGAFRQGLTRSSLSWERNPQNQDDDSSLRRHLVGSSMVAAKTAFTKRSYLCDNTLTAVIYAGLRRWYAPLATATPLQVSFIEIIDRIEQCKRKKGSASTDHLWPQDVLMARCCERCSHTLKTGIACTLVFTCHDMKFARPRLLFLYFVESSPQHRKRERGSSRLDQENIS